MAEGPHSLAASALSMMPKPELVLRAWEAINVERDLSNVLAAVAKVIEPLVTVKAIGAIAFEPSQPSPYAYYRVRGAREPLIPEDVDRRFEEVMKGPWGKHPFVDMDSSTQAKLSSNFRSIGKAYLTRFQTFCGRISGLLTSGKWR